MLLLLLLLLFLRLHHPPTYPATPPTSTVAGPCTVNETLRGLWEVPMWDVQDANGAVLTNMDPQVGSCLVAGRGSRGEGGRSQCLAAVLGHQFGPPGPPGNGIISWVAVWVGGWMGGWE